MKKRQKIFKTAPSYIMYTLLLTAVFYVSSGWLFAEETLASNAQATEKTLASPKVRKIAVLVGVNNYADTVAFGNLKYAVDDMNLLAEQLEKSGFKHEDITLLKRDIDAPHLDPTKENIEKAFEKALKTAQSGDFVFLAFSGHGAEKDGMTFLCPQDFRSNDQENTGVSVQKLVRSMNSSKAKFKMLVVDACRDNVTGSKGESEVKPFRLEMKNAQESFDLENIQEGLVLLQSCGPGEQSWESEKLDPQDPEAGHSVFTWYLVEALRGEGSADTDSNGELTLKEVCVYTEKKTRDYSRIKGNRQKPTFTASLSVLDSFVIADGLLIDGISKSAWQEAEGLYQEAQKLRQERKFSEAKEKIDLACSINTVRQEYKNEAKTITDFLAMQSDIFYQEAQKLRLEGKYSEAKTKIVSARDIDSKNQKYLDEEKIIDELISKPILKPGERRVIMIKGIDYAFHWCPPGTFSMGSPENERGRSDLETEHQVNLTKGFWILETEVTQEMWESVMGDNPSWFCKNGGGKNEVSGDTKKYPVECVSWNDCQSFIAELNKSVKLPAEEKFSLPTEAQWEYACRAGTETPYNFGNALNGDQASCDGSSPYGTKDQGKTVKNTTPVAIYPSNDWGVFDMHGNLWEWCSDWYDSDYYANSPVIDPEGPYKSSDSENPGRVNRGGCWYDYPKLCRSASRSRNTPDGKSKQIGFRFILVP